MAENINRCIFSGNLTRKPEIKDTAGGSKVARMRLAVNSRVKRQGEWGDKANFLDIVAFGRTAENCAQYLDKGSPIMADCRADWSEWQAQDGSPRQGVAFIADNIQFLSSGEPRSTATSTPASDIPADDFAPAAASSAPDDDIPF